MHLWPLGRLLNTLGSLICHPVPGSLICHPTLSMPIRFSHNNVLILGHGHFLGRRVQMARAVFRQDGSNGACRCSTEGFKWRLFLCRRVKMTHVFRQKFKIARVFFFDGSYNDTYCFAT
jgi:hypothetical protein